MSNYWDVRCLDCKSDLGIDNANHAVDLMRLIIMHAKAIAALAPFLKETDRIGYNIDFSFGSGCRIQVAWFVVHAAHHLVPVDEYGTLDGECGVRVACSVCGKDDHCRLAQGHTGDHAGSPI